MLKTHDSGALDTYGSDCKWFRTDHNIIPVNEDIMKYLFKEIIQNNFQLSPADTLAINKGKYILFLDNIIDKPDIDAYDTVYKSRKARYVNLREEFVLAYTFFVIKTNK